jgi:hypothetical protein
MAKKHGLPHGSDDLRITVLIAERDRQGMCRSKSFTLYRDSFEHVLARVCEVLEVNLKGGSHGEVDQK